MEKIREKTKKAFIPNVENEFQPRILRPRNLFILAVVLLLIKFLIFSWFFYFPKTPQFAIVTSTRLVELANQERVALGLQPLKINPQLVQAAQAKAQDMVTNNYFDHISPKGTTPWYWLDKIGYKYIAAGENLARDFTESQYLHQAWMDSSSHRKNILNKKYQEIGIAVVEGTINNKKTVLAVQFFGGPTKTATSSYVETPLAISSEEKVEVKSEETILKGPLVFAQRENLEKIIEKPKAILNIQNIYFIILGVLILVLGLTIFINIRVQYPKLIFIALIFIVLIAAMALFNGQEFLNRGIEVL